MSPLPPPFVTATDLPGRHPAPVLVDVRWYLDGRSGRDAYEAAHLPGAVFLDLDHWLAAPDAGPGPRSGAGGRHPLPSPETFAEGLARAGVADDDHVVAYDDLGGVVAARLVWLLRASDRPASLLDGGLRAWDGPVEAGVQERARAVREVRPWPAARLADLDEVADLGATSGVGGGPVLLDARDAGRYRGDHEPVDPRAGHVPGAVSAPASAALLPDGRLRPVAELRAALAAAGVAEGTDVVASCGSGITACFTLLLLEHAGLGQGRLWPGSFSAWSRDPARPVVTGDRPH